MEIFKEKMKLSKSRTMAHFIRKCVLEIEIYYVDLEPFRDIQWLLSSFTNYVNQTGVIYKKNIEKIREDLDALSIKGWNIHDLLMK